MKKEKPDWIFMCRKCQHQVYVGKEVIKKMLNYDCPECGEEFYENWILIGEGDFNNQKLSNPQGGEEMCGGAL